jgi:hypothetical protein
VHWTPIRTSLIVLVLSSMRGVTSGLTSDMMRSSLLTMIN